MVEPAVVRRVASVEGRETRLALWAEWVRTVPALDAAHALDDAARGAAAGHAEALAAYLPLLDLPRLQELASPGTLSEVLVAAREAGLEGGRLLLEHRGPPAAPPELGPPPDPVIENLSLGHRKAAARGLRGPLLDRILRDPDPRVVREVLRNPRLRESEVLAVASRRPCPEGVFWALVRAERWLRRPPVRLAMALNPNAPPRLAASLTPTLAAPALAEIAQEERLHPAVRDGALLVARWRRGGHPEG